MDRLQNVFKEESQDLLDNLEQSLLQLEDNIDDENLIAEIFRAMHTLKGSSSMFGFTKIADFVHNLETLYALIRDKKLTASPKVIDCTFEVLDLMKLLMSDPMVTNVANMEIYSALMKRILAFLEGHEGGKTESKEVESSESVILFDDESTREMMTYYIHFDPQEQIFDDGTNPLYLVEELAGMGKIQVFTYVKESGIAKDYTPEKCYTSWELLLATESSVSEIQDVFVFVEDTATIEIEKIYNGNLLQDRKFVKAIPYQGLDGDKITLEAIEKLIENSDLNIMEYNATEETSVVTETMVDKEEAGALGNSSPLQKEKNISSIRVSSDKLDELMNLVSELVTTQAGLSLFSENNHNPTLESIAENVEKLSRQLRDIAFTMTLIPINNLFGRFQRMIRDVSHNLNKSVSFITQGGETELDKTIIEQLTDPLLHLLRNSLDHGIETPEERIKAGKSPTGKITLRSYYSGVNVFIQIEDDGKGIDSDEIRSSAIKKGLIDSSDELSEKEIFDLIFAAGFSTAKKVTDVSGRGVGMDVVRRNIADIRGEITIDSKPGKGTLITLKLPLTLSIIDGLLVKIYDTFYLIPLSVVSKCYEVTQEDLDDDFNRVVILDGEQIPFINLRKNFDVTEDAPDFFQLIVVENEGRKVGITVDTIIGEYQAVLKPLGKYYKHQDFISGGTILGDGTIALVMDTGKIVYKFLSETKEEHV